MCIPLFDEICRRLINFIRSCLSDDSSLVRRMAQYAVNHARPSSSFLGQNMVFCTRRYNCTLRELLDNPVSNIVRLCVCNSFDENMRCFASFLFELIIIRSNRLRVCLSDDSFFTRRTAAYYRLRLHKLVSAHPFDLFAFLFIRCDYVLRVRFPKAA